MEVLAPILEMPSFIEEAGVSIQHGEREKASAAVPGVVSIKKETEPAPVPFPEVVVTEPVMKPLAPLSEVVAMVKKPVEHWIPILETVATEQNELLRPVLGVAD